jgi:hypothetical protein
MARLLAFADEYRVQHHMTEPSRYQRGGNCADGRRAAQHADLHGVQNGPVQYRPAQHRRRACRRTVGRRRGFQLIRDDLLVQRHKTVVPVVVRIEGDDARQVGDAENAQFLEGLQVRLGAGAARGFGAGDRQYDSGRSGGSCGRLDFS